MVGLFGLIACPWMFGAMGDWWAKTLVIIGFVIQLLLLALLLLCLFRARIILRIGGWGISLLAKMHIIKKPDKWRERMENMVNKYRSCRSVLKKHPMMFFNALILNIAQRVSQTLIPCFVIMASSVSKAYNVTFLELFCMQAYVMIGYNSIPLPGGTGVYEVLYPSVFGIGGYDMLFILSAMMVSRAISYYICMIVTGLYTLVYHAVGIKKIKDGGGEVTEPAAGALEALAAGGDIIGAAVAEKMENDRVSDKPDNNVPDAPDEPPDTTGSNGPEPYNENTPPAGAEIEDFAKETDDE